MEMTLGTKIKELRKLNGMSQEYLAEQMDVSRQAISKWENDTAQPSSQNLYKLAQLFGVSAEELMHPNARVELVVNVRKEFVSMKNSKPTICLIVFSTLAFVASFSFGIYSTFSNTLPQSQLLYVMIFSAVSILLAILPIFIAMLRFVYRDCKSIGANPVFWVLVSTTFVGLAVYLIMRESLAKRATS